ncbi:MAG: hypothetical protein H6936_13705 [Burkholderiales bacterium]|nr:hypothetical protein [Burkholderiales bacterium]
MKPTVNNLGVSHENGTVEAAHGSFKHRNDQAIKVRDSADFPTIEAYHCFFGRNCR